MGGRAGLGEAIGLDQIAAGEGLESLLHLDRKRRGPTQADADGTQVEFADLGMVDNAHVAGRNGRIEGGRVFAD